MSKKYIKEAEQNILNHAKFWMDFLEVVSTMQYNVGLAVDNHHRGDALRQGFDLLRQGAFDELQFALGRCFCFSEVGGEESKKFSREMAQKFFGHDHEVMSLLEKHLRIPSYWSTKTEDEFRAEISQELDS